MWSYVNVAVNFNKIKRFFKNKINKNVLKNHVFLIVEYVNWTNQVFNMLIVASFFGDQDYLISV